MCGNDILRISDLSPRQKKSRKNYSSGLHVIIEFFLINHTKSELRFVVTRVCRSLEYTSGHPVPCTLYPAPCTLHHVPCTLYPAPCPMHPAPLFQFSRYFTARPSLFTYNSEFSLMQNSLTPTSDPGFAQS